MAAEILGTREMKWPDRATGPWALRLTFAIVDDRPGVVGIEMYAIDPADIAASASGWPDFPAAKAAGRNPVPIQTSAARFPLGELLDQFLTGQKKTARILSGAASAPPWTTIEKWRADAEKRLRRIEETTPEPRRPGRPTLYDRSHFEAVAEVYSSALAAGQYPTKAVVDTFKVSRPTAVKWVARARELKLLRKTDRGRAAGRPPAAKPTMRGATRSGKGKE